MKATNGIPDLRVREPRPFRDWVLEARRLGYEMRYDVEQNEFKLWVMLKPVTRRAKTATDRALGEADAYIMAETVYDKARAQMAAEGFEPPPIVDLDKVLAFAIDDTAAFAMRMAQEAMARG